MKNRGGAVSLAGELSRPGLSGFRKAFEMRRQQLISKLIDLDEQARAHCCEYLKLIRTAGSEAKASLHSRKELKLRARIKDLMKQIARRGLSER